MSMIDSTLIPVTTENISTTKETPNVKKILFYTDPILQTGLEEVLQL